MDAPIFRATWQAGALSGLSNVCGQAITCYQNNTSFRLNYVDLGHFVLFAVLSCPPNFLWQMWLEKQFPGYTVKGKEKVEEPQSFAHIAEGDKPAQSKDFNKRNTAIKFALDQSLGAAVNTLAFIAGMGLLGGKSWDVVIQDCREGFWPLIFAGQKLWPLVSIISFTLVPAEHRTAVGSVVGLFWGIYLSLLSASAK